MWGLKKAGPPQGMEPEEAFLFALLALAGFVFWMMLFPLYGVIR